MAIVNSIHFENTDLFQKIKANKALKNAKKLEAQQLESGKKFIKINNKTIVLR